MLFYCFSRRHWDEVEHHPSYHGSLSEEEAEAILNKVDDSTCYLTRYSEAKSAYMLSVKKTDALSYLHLKIERVRGEGRGRILFQINETKRNNFEELLQHLGDKEVILYVFKGIGSSVPHAKKPEVNGLQYY